MHPIRKEIKDLTRRAHEEGLIIRPRTLAQAIKESLLTIREAEKIQALEIPIKTREEKNAKEVYIFYDPKPLARKNARLYTELTLLKQIEEKDKPLEETQENEPGEWTIKASYPDRANEEQTFSTKKDALKEARLIEAKGGVVELTFTPLREGLLDA